MTPNNFYIPLSISPSNTLFYRKTLTDWSAKEQRLALRPLTFFTTSVPMADQLQITKRDCHKFGHLNGRF